MLDRSIAPAVKSLDQFVIPAPRREVLPNGIPLNILNIGEKKIIRIDFVFEAGRWQQDYSLQALFTNRMLREGTQTLSSAEIAETLDFYGAWLDLSVSAAHAFITLYSLEKYLEPTLKVLSSMLSEPAFPEKELEVMAENNYRQYLIGQTKTDVLARRALLQALYGERHPYGRLAYEEDYRRITPALLKDFFGKYYHAGNCVVFLSGKISETCVQLIHSLFGTTAFPQAPKPAPRTFVMETTPEKQLFVEQPTAIQSSVRMGMLTIGTSHPDFMKLRVLMTLFGGYFGSRLMSNIREEKGYTYGISAGIVPYRTDGMFLLAAETAPEFVRPLIAEVYHEIDKLHTDLVSEEELAMVKNYMTGDLCRSYESAFSIADAWIYATNLGLPDTHFSDTFRAVKEVTAEEIRQLARRYLCKESLKEAVSGKKMS